MDKSMAFNYVPAKINMAALVQLMPPEFKYHIDNFNYILSLITEIPAYNERALYNGYILLNSKMLQQRIREYSHYLRYLLRNKILLTDNHYIPGEKSRGYKFHPRVISPVVLIPITRRCLIKSFHKPIKEDKASQTKYPELYRSFNYRFKIDLPGAIKFLNNQLEQDMPTLGVNKAILRFNKNYVSASKLASRRIFFHVDTTGNRLHTNLTSLKSSLRNYISYDRQVLHSYDLINSQALLSCLVLDAAFYATKNEVEFIDLGSLKVDRYINNDTIQSITSLIMLVKEGQRPECHDIENYIKHCQAGTIYEYINDETEKKTGKRIKCRRELKEMVFTVLFSDNRFIGQAEAGAKRLFRDMFPNVYEIFSLLKKKESTLLPILLQRIEAQLMLDRIVPALTKKFPGKPFFTIHDSLATVPGDEEEIRGIINEEMKKATGLTCEVRTEIWAS